MGLLDGLLRTDPLQRLTIAQVQQHPWVARNSQLGGGGAAQPEDRATAATARLDLDDPPPHRSLTMSEEEASFDRQQPASSSADLNDPPVYRSLASMEDEWQVEEQSAFFSATALDPFDDDALVYRSLAP